MRRQIVKETEVIQVQGSAIDVDQYRRNLEEDPQWVRHWTERRSLLTVALKASGCSPVNPCQTIEQAVELHIEQEKKQLLAQTFEPWCPPAGFGTGLINDVPIDSGEKK